MAKELELKQPGSFFGTAFKPDKPGLLAQRFIVPPFSVLEARAGYWQERKRAWLSLGIQSELGRGAATYQDHEWMAEKLGQVQAANTDGVKALLNRAVNHAVNHAAPGGSTRPAMDYRNNERGDGAGKPFKPRMASAGLLNPAEGDLKKDLLKLRDRQKIANRGLPGPEEAGGRLASGLINLRNRGKADAETYGTGGPGTMDAQRKAWRENGKLENGQPAATVYGSGGPGSLAKGFKQGKAIPGGGTGKNSAYMFRTPEEGYQPFGELVDAGAAVEATGTSIFDPVLTECLVRWFCPAHGHVLDPFAGGSVRGIVTNHLGRRYTGIDLREEQIAANRPQGARITPDNQPVWIAGDSLDEIPKLRRAGYQSDFVFSCPPYADLEVYSDNPRDISTMEYPQFLEVYAKIIKRACRTLKPNRFAAFVVGEVRNGTDGSYLGFVDDTKRAFEASGLKFYNSMILVTAVGSLPIRISRQFKVARKIGCTHQHILVFVKGDPRKAARACSRKRLHENGDDDHTMLPHPKARKRQVVETASLSGGLTWGVTEQPYIAGRKQKAAEVALADAADLIETKKLAKLV